VPKKQKKRKRKKKAATLNLRHISRHFSTRSKPRKTNHLENKERVGRESKRTEIKAAAKGHGHGAQACG